MTTIEAACLEVIKAFDELESAQTADEFREARLFAMRAAMSNAKLLAHSLWEFLELRKGAA